MRGVVIKDDKGESSHSVNVSQGTESQEGYCSGVEYPMTLLTHPISSILDRDTTVYHTGVL